MSDLLETALNPKSVAVIGASDDIHKIGGRPIHYMRKFGFAGRIHPVNPARTEVQGLKCYASLADLPEAPDLALIIVGGEKAMAAVDDCAARGVKSALVIASGFGEVDAAGREMQHAMAGRARSAGMRLYGPNSQGLANFGSGAIASFSTMFAEMPPADGPIAVVSQSGGMSAMLYGLLRARGLGVRHVHATGNEADVTVSELAWAVAHDPEVRLLLLYLENIADPEMLARTAGYARERNLPIVAVKAGRSARGQQAASSHTGALANEDRTVDAFLRHHGIWRVHDPHAQALAAEAYLKGWRPAGRRLVVISNSGASCVMAADTAEEHGLPLAELSPGTRKAVAACLPGFATAANPIDLTAALLSNSGLLGEVLPVVGADSAADLFLIDIPVAGIGYDVEAFADDAVKFEAQTGKPLAVAAWQASVAAPFKARGIPTFGNGTEALAVLAQLNSHSELMRESRSAWLPEPPISLPPGAGHFLDEAQSLALLASRGVKVVEHRLCRTASEVREAWPAIGPPAVLKACSADVPHKSEHGLVALGVDSAEQAVALFETQWAKLAELGAAREGVLLAAMHRGRHEFMVGGRLDPVFGPVVVVGEGGTFVEAMPDLALLLPPFDAAEVKKALRALRIAPLLDGVRGLPPLDVEALAAVVISVGRLIVAAGGCIASIDVNPVLVGAVGEGAVAVDALVERGG